MSNGNNKSFVLSDISSIDSAIEIDLTKAKGGGFGFNVVGGKDRPHIPGHAHIFVSSIRSDSPAEASQKIKVGDRVVSVNGIPLDNLSHAEAVKIFQQSPKVAKLVIEPDAENSILAIMSMNSSGGTAPFGKASRLAHKNNNMVKNSTPRNGSVIGKTNAEQINGTDSSSPASPHYTTAPNTPTVDNQKPLSEIIPMSSPSTMLASTHLNDFGTPAVNYGHEGAVFPDTPNGAVHSFNSYKRQNIRLSSVDEQPACTSSNQNGMPTVNGDTFTTMDRPSSYIDDLPKTPKRTPYFLDPNNPSLLTEVIYVSIGAVAIGGAVYLVYRSFKSR